MTHFISALHFMTILPLGRQGRFEPRRMVPHFPLVGLLIGSMLCLVDSLGAALFPSETVAVIDVVFLTIVTGAFHLDGLGDAADGLFSHRSRERALEIMKDSRVGVMGLVTIVSVLAIKWGGIHGLRDHRLWILLLVPSLSRCSALFGMRFLAYGRPEGGTGHDFFLEPLGLRAFWGLSIPLALACMIGLRGLVMLAGFALLTALILLFYHRKMGCITGDMLGAGIEITEALLFLLASTGALS